MQGRGTAIRLAALGLLLGAFHPGGTEAAEWKGSSFVALDYDRRLAGYCGLLTEAAQRGFAIRSGVLRSSQNLAPDDLDRARVHAILAMDHGWTNYNKAGKRSWCAGAGREAAANLEGYLATGGAEGPR